MHNLNLAKRIGVMIITPVIFLLIGYSLMYVIGQPVIQFATSSLNMLLLSDVPEFDTSGEPVAFTSIEENEDQSELASSSITYPVGGEQYGEVVIDSLAVDEPLYYGDTNEILRLGAGQYMGSVYPGEIGTSLIGGHNTETFGRLIGVAIGEVVTINTTYANYQYQVTQVDIRHKDDEEIAQLLEQREKSMVILYSCYPVDSVGMTDDRVFVQCELIAGPVINEEA